MRRLSIMLVALGLAACHGKQPATGKSAAAAEVLPGSASDVMIAYDTLKSQPPLAAPEQPGANEEGDRSARGFDGAGDTPAQASDAAPPSDAEPAASAPAE